MKEIFSNKKVLEIVLIAAIAIVALLLILQVVGDLGNSKPLGGDGGNEPVKSEPYITQSDKTTAIISPDDTSILQSERGLSFMPSQEGVVSETNGTRTHYIYPEGYKERAEIEIREFIKSIDDNIIGEIDSQTQPVGISPETTIFVENGGYDLVIKGALSIGITSIDVYDARGKIIDSTEYFMMDDEFRIPNIAPGEYRVVVERYNHPDVNVNCLLVIILEFRAPKIESPSLIAKSQISVKNECAADLVFENNGNKTIIAAYSTSLIKLTEGANSIVYYLIDGDNVSPEKEYRILSDTKPPVIKLKSTMEKYKDGEGRVVFNMYANEHCKYIKINGKEMPQGTPELVPPGEKPSYAFAHVEDISVKSIVVEASDMAGNVTKVTLHRDDSELGVINRN